MKKIKYRIVIVILSIILAVFIFFNTNYFIKKQEWKHRDGASVGDWIAFDNSFYSVKGRTIYKKDKEVGKIIFCLGKMLIIKETATGENGNYINKTNF